MTQREAHVQYRRDVCGLFTVPLDLLPDYVDLVVAERKAKRAAAARKGFVTRRRNVEAAVADPPAIHPPVAGDRKIVLSPQQARVLGMLAAGMNNGQIARKLNVEVSTVKEHKKRLYALLGSCTAAQAVARGYQLGYLMTERRDDQ